METFDKFKMRYRDLEQQLSLTKNYIPERRKDILKQSDRLKEKINKIKKK